METLKNKTVKRPKYKVKKINMVIMLSIELFFIHPVNNVMLSALLFVIKAVKD